MKPHFRVIYITRYFLFSIIIIIVWLGNKSFALNKGYL
jgi:hypothetical protein